MRHVADIAVPERRTSRAEPDDAALAFDGIRHAFGSTQVLERVAFKVPDRQFVAVLGPSGCGKSTLLQMAAGLLRPSEGQVRQRGRVIAGVNRAVGFVPQQAQLLPWKTLLDNVAFPLVLRGVKRAECLRRAEAAIEAVDLAGFEQHFPYQLSGGMQKRASIARTLVYEPDVILMDEPFGALDAQTRMQLYNDLQALVMRAGASVLLVTHDVTEAVVLADRVVVLSRRPAVVRDTLRPSSRAASWRRGNPGAMRLRRVALGLPRPCAPRNDVVASVSRAAGPCLGWFRLTGERRPPAQQPLFRAHRQRAGQHDEGEQDGDAGEQDRMAVYRRTLASALACLALAPAARAADAVRIGQATTSLSFLPLWAARALDTFGKENLSLQWAAIPSGDPACLDAGDLDLAAVGGDTLLAAVAKGQPFRAVATLMDRVTLDLVVSKPFLERTKVAPGDPLPKRLAAPRARWWA